MNAINSSRTLSDFRCDVFIKSFRPDLPWLKYCLRSVAKYWKGSGETVVVVPPDCVIETQTLLHAGQRVVGQEELFKEGYSVVSRPPGYLFQQYVKMTADTYTDAPLIFFIDSDAVFIRECGPEDFTLDGLPFIHYEDYEYFRERHAGVYAWKGMVEAVLRVRVEHEFMRAMGMLYWADSLKKFRDYIQRLHGGRSTADIIHSAPGGGFSEWNTLGAWCYTHDTDRYRFIKKEYPGDHWPIKSHWSWGGLTPAIEMELAGITQ